MGDGNFQDYVSLNPDTLYHKGAQLYVGTTTATTVIVGFSNSAGQLALAATATGNATAWLPSAGGTLAVLTNIGITALAAGSQTATAGAVVFSNSNGITFGMSNSSVVTASFSAAAASINVSAGTTSNNLTALTFSNSNGVSFGLNGSTLTASIATSLTNINVSAGTTSNNLSAITFSNSNNVSFGLNGSTLTASATVASTQASINLSAGTTSNLASAFTFSNSNGISFGLNASTITASVATSLTAINVSAGTTSNNLSAITFSNSNGVSFGLNGSTLTASFAQLVTAFSQLGEWNTNFGISLNTLSFQKVSFAMNLSATQLICLADFEQASGSTGAVTISHAVYTFNASTASLASSGSRAISWTSGSQTSASSRYGGASGTQYRTVGVNYSMTPGDYLFAWWVSTANSVTVNLFGRGGPTIVNVFDGVETSNFLDGTSVSSTNAFPASIAATNTNYARTGVAALRQPGVILVGTGF